MEVYELNTITINEYYHYCYIAIYVLVNCAPERYNKSSNLIICIAPFTRKIISRADAYYYRKTCSINNADFGLFLYYLIIYNLY